MKKLKKILLSVLLVFLGLVLVIGGVFLVFSQTTRLPATLNMSVPGSGPSTSIAQLTGPQTQAPIKTFELTAREANLDLGGGKTAPAYTFNGTSPGPELRVQEGDRIIVKVTNNL